MANKKQIPFKDFLQTEEGVNLQQEAIRKNIPFDLGSTKFNQPIATSPQAMSQPNVIRNAGLQMVPEEPVSSSEDDTNFLGSLIAQGVAGIGTGLMGGTPRDIANSANMFQYMRDQQTKRNKSDLLMDPKSEESKKRRLVFKNLGYDVPEDLSYTDLGDSDVLRSLRSRQMEQPKLAGSTRQGGVGKPEKEKKNPFQKEINFINIYSKNGLQALDELKKLIETKGTSELFGSSATKMDQYIRDIAIAKTKILDPNSVISQGEIDSVKKTLGLDDYTRVFTSDKSAIEGLENFKNILQNNRNNAINILESLPSEESFSEKENFIIEAYRNNPNDEDTKRAYENMMKSKGR